MSEESNNVRKSMTSQSTRMSNSKQDVLVKFYSKKESNHFSQSPNKSQIQNLEQVQKLSFDDPIIGQQQKHIQHIQKITQFNTQRIITTAQNPNLHIQNSSQLPLNNTQRNKIQPFQFFVPPKKVEQIMNNNLLRNTSLPTVNQNININQRQSTTSYKPSRLNHQSSHDFRSQNQIADEEEDKNIVISDNNFIISSSIQRVKGTANNSIDQFNQLSKMTVPNSAIQQQSGNLDMQITPLQSKFQGNSVIQANYAVGIFTPTKEDLVKKQIYQFQNGSKCIKQKMNISQFMQKAQSSSSSSQNQLQIQSGSLIQNNFQTLRNQLNQNPSLISNTKNKNDSNQTNNLLKNCTSQESKSSNYATQQQFPSKASNQTNSPKKGNKATTELNPPNINEFLERELFLKKQKSAKDTNIDKSKYQMCSQQLEDKQRLKVGSLSNNSSIISTSNNKNMQSNDKGLDIGELEKIQRGGLMNYIESTFIDCEYMYKEQVQKQMIQLRNLFDNPEQQDSSTQTLDTPLMHPTHAKQITKTSDYRDIKKQVEKLLCIEVAKKKERKNTDLNFAIEQMTNFEEILRDGLKKSLEQLNTDCKSTVLELVTSVLLLQTKKHIIVEKNKRDQMILFLAGLKDQEKHFKVNIFGAEADVEAFRFKVGEIEKENTVLQNQLKTLTEKHNQLLTQNQKQRKLSTIIKNEYLNLRTVNQNLNQRLNQKLESYEKKLSRTLDPLMISQLLQKSQFTQNLPSQALSELMNSAQTIQQGDDKRSSLVNMQQLHIDQNLLGAVGQSQISQQFEYSSTPTIISQNNLPFFPHSPLASLIQLQIPNFTSKGQSQVFHDSDDVEDNLKKGIQNDEQMKIDLQINEEQEDDDEDEEGCNIEDILRETSKITKVDNHEVLIKEVRETIPLLYYNKDCQTDPKITNPKNTSTNAGMQTDLQLLDTEFDHIMHNDRLKQVSKQEEIKEQLLNFSELSDNDESEANKSAHIFDDSSNSKIIFQRLKKRISIVRLLRGLPIKKKSKQIRKKEIEQFSDNINILKNFLESSNSLSDESLASVDESDYDEYEADGSAQQGSSKIIKKSNEENSLGQNKQSHLKKSQINSKHSNSNIPTPSNATKDNCQTNISGQKKQQSLNHQGSGIGKTPITIKNRLSNFNQEVQMSLFSKVQPDEDSSPKQQSPLGISNDSKTTQRRKKDIKEANQILIDNKEDLKMQIFQVVKLYNLETEKCSNYEESFQQLINVK